MKKFRNFEKPACLLPRSLSTKRMNCNHEQFILTPCIRIRVTIDDRFYFLRVFHFERRVILPFSPFLYRAVRRNWKYRWREKERGGKKEREKKSLEPSSLHTLARRETSKRTRDAGNAMGRGANTGSKRIIKRRGGGVEPPPPYTEVISYAVFLFL